MRGSSSQLCCRVGTVRCSHLCGGVASCNLELRLATWLLLNRHWKIPSFRVASCVSLQLPVPWHNVVASNEKATSVCLVPAANHPSLVRFDTRFHSQKKVLLS